MLRLEIGIAALEQSEDDVAVRLRLGYRAAERVTGSLLEAEPLGLSAVEIRQRGRPESGSPCAPKQQRAHWLPAQCDLRIRRAPEIAVMVVTRRKLRFDRCDERQVRFDEERADPARGVLGHDVGCDALDVACFLNRGRMVLDALTASFGPCGESDRAPGEAPPLRRRAEIDLVERPLGGSGIGCDFASLRAAGGPRRPKGRTD